MHNNMNVLNAMSCTSKNDENEKLCYVYFTTMKRREKTWRNVQKETIVFFFNKLYLFEKQGAHVQAGEGVEGVWERESQADSPLSLILGLGLGAASHGCEIMTELKSTD